MLTRFLAGVPPILASLHFCCIVQRLSKSSYSQKLRLIRSVNFMFLSSHLKCDWSEASVRIRKWIPKIGWQMIQYRKCRSPY